MSAELEELKQLYSTYKKVHPSPVLKEEYPDLYNADGSINLESESAKNFLSDYKPPEAFDKIGYARSLGGFFYQFFFAIIGAIIIGITYPLMLKYLYPWPESKSYAEIAGVIFLFVESLFNVPTSYAIERFIGEWRIKDTRKMMQYIRFYIWYQMMTGVFLVAGFSFFILQILSSENSLVWAKWLMLITISREFPANTSVFLSSLKGLQQFQYESVLNFINGSFIRPAFEVGFVLWGRYVLGENPVFGPLVGISIGYAIGTYVDDFVSMALAGWYLNRAIKPMGYTLMDCFIPHVDKEVMITAIKFGFAVALPGLLGSIWAMVTTLWWYEAVPAYLTFVALSKLADEIANIIKRGGGINIKATLSEAYNNGKIALTSYYVSLSWKFIFFFMFALGSVVFSLMPLLIESLFGVLGAEDYILAAGFIVPNLIASTIEEPMATAENIILGANKPKFIAGLRIIFDIINVGFIYLWLFVFKIQDNGISAIVWLLPMALFIPNTIQLYIRWRYINKEICPVQIKKFGWQTFVAPIAPAIIVGLLAELWRIFIFPPLANLLGNFMSYEMSIIVAGTISILFAFIFLLMFTFFPLYTAFGGWDEHNINIFHEAVLISGPSKFLFAPIDKANNFLGKKSPLHNKYPIPHELAEIEALELMKERHIKDKLVQIVKKRGEFI